MRFWELGKKNLKDVWRDRIGLAFLLGFPIIFMLLVGLAFGHLATPPLEIGLIDEDNSPTSKKFIEALEKTPNLMITPYLSASEAERWVKLGRETGFILIPQGFEETVIKKRLTGEGEIHLIIGYDPTHPLVAAGLHITLHRIGSSFFGFDTPLKVEVKNPLPEVKRPIINRIAPSLIIFGLMILITTVSSTIVRHKQTGFLTRLATTPARPWEFVLGYSLPFTLVGLASIPLYLAIAIALGMKIVGSLPFAILLYLLFAVLCVGIGMIVGSLTKTYEQAQGLSWLIIIPLSAISGVWYPTEGMPGYIKALANIFPFKYAVEASRNLISRGGGWEAISIDFPFIFIWMVFSFALGIMLFRRAIVR